VNVSYANVPAALMNAVGTPEDAGRADHPEHERLRHVASVEREFEGESPCIWRRVESSDKRCRSVILRVSKATDRSASGLSAKITRRFTVADTEGLRLSSSSRIVGNSGT
jgi:hypothetical protein